MTPAEWDDWLLNQKVSKTVWLDDPTDRAATKPGRALFQEEALYSSAMTPAKATQLVASDDASGPRISFCKDSLYSVPDFVMVEEAIDNMPKPPKVGKPTPTRDVLTKLVANTKNYWM